MKKLLFSAGALAAVAVLSAGARVVAQDGLPLAPKPGVNLIKNVGIGIGNRTVVINDGPAGSKTIVCGVKNGIGNKTLIVNGKVVECTPEEWQKTLKDLDLPPWMMKHIDPPAVAPPALPQPPAVAPADGQAPAARPAQPNWLRNLIRSATEKALGNVLDD